MQENPWRIFVLSAFIFLLAFKPSEPHLTRFLREVKGFEDDTINNDIYVVWTYAYLPFLLLCAPLASAIGDINTIAVGAACRLVTRMLLLFGTETWHMIVMEVFYSGGSAAETVFFAYVFTVVPKDWHGTATASTQSAFMISQLISSVLGDVMLHAMGASLQSTLWVSAASVALACASLAFLPQQVPAALHRASTGPTHDRMALTAAATAHPTPSTHPASLEMGITTNDANQSRASTAKADSSSGSPDHEVASHTLDVPGEDCTVEQDGFRSDISRGKTDVGAPAGDTSTHAHGPFDGLVRGWALLRQAWALPSYRGQAILWVAGAAAWQFVFGWEASLYDEAFPSASSDWNGSVLSGMLIFGAGGAAAVGFKSVDLWLDGRSLQGLFLPFGLAAVCVGVLAAVFWLRNGAAMLSVLALMFLCWNLWNAGFFVVTARVISQFGSDKTSWSSAQRQGSQDCEVADSDDVSVGLASGGAAAHASTGDSLSGGDSPIHLPLLAGDGHPTGVPPGDSGSSGSSDETSGLTGLSQVFVVNQALGLLLQVVLQSVLLTWINLDLQPLYGACAVVILAGITLGGAEALRSSGVLAER